MITDLPPPRFSPAALHLSVIARARSSASRAAISKLGYGCIRTPPFAGPSTVEWRQMTAWSPTDESLQTSSRS